MLLPALNTSLTTKYPHLALNTLLSTKYPFDHSIPSKALTSPFRNLLVIFFVYLKTLPKLLTILPNDVQRTKIFANWSKFMMVVKFSFEKFQQSRADSSAETRTQSKQPVNYQYV
jgi:hypothetical protein